MSSVNILVRDLQNYCKKVAVVGDIRRQCEEVAVIELQAVSRTIEMTDLFGTQIEPYPVINDWMRESGLNFTGNRADCKYFDWQGERVILHLTSEYQWGLQMALLTGSRHYTDWLVTPRRKGGALPGTMAVRDGWLWMKDKKVTTPTETAFFDCIETEWVRPEMRTEGAWR